MPDLSPAQRSIVEGSLDQHIFVSGPAGTGKSTAGVQRLEYLLSRGIAGESILVLTPQRTLQEPYLDLLYSPQRKAGGEATAATIGGLARRTCDLFWTLGAEAAGFKHPELPPLFLTLETAQYYMAHIVRPLLEKGFFESLTIDRNRLYAQILDNLNKAAVVGFPHQEIGSRLESAWFGDPSRRRVFADTQECASLFRAYCLDHNLMDFSLQMEVFTKNLWPLEQVRDFLKDSYRHLIYDNLEEDPPFAHDIVREWLPAFDSAVMLYDEGAGYRNFLGGDAISGRTLAEGCEATLHLEQSFVSSAEVAWLSSALGQAIDRGNGPVQNRDGARAFEILNGRFYPEMLDRVISKIRALIDDQGLAPEEIVILAPYLSDALRFSITHRLDQANIPWRTHRPSRSLRDEPASRSLLTLCALAHPHWNIHPPKFDMARALSASLGADRVRAHLLAEIVYRPRDLRLSSFEEIKPDMQERITYALGGRYASLRDWLTTYRSANPLPLDFFLRRLFGELLSQPGFGYHKDLDAVRVTGSLIESIKKFRHAMDPAYVGRDSPSFDLGREYLTLLEEGVIAAQYLESWRSEGRAAVLVAPAHTFLMMNYPVSVQFWLDPGSNGWVERVAQPLTQPHVLSRQWEPGRTWTDSDEVQAATEALGRLVRGLLARCRERIYLALADLGEAGFEDRGVMLRAFQRVLQSQGG
jgi:hypothetical protein